MLLTVIHVLKKKMTNDRNKISDYKATKILALVHSDLVGPIQTLAKDGYWYIINFIGGYSGLTMSYFLKYKSDTLLASTKYLADITLYSQTTERNSLFTDRQRNGIHFWNFSTVTCT